jgi:hypothetical protein
LTGDPIVVVVVVVVTNDRVEERVIGVGIAWKALMKLVIATKRRRMVTEEIIMEAYGGSKHGVGPVHKRWLLIRGEALFYIH